MKFHVFPITLLGIVLSISSCASKKPDTPVDEGMNKTSGFNIASKGAYNTVLTPYVCTSWNDYSETVSLISAKEYSNFFIKLNFEVGNHTIEDVWKMNELDAYFSTSVRAFDGTTRSEIPDIKTSTPVKRNWILEWILTYDVKNAASVHTTTSDTNKYDSYVSMNTLLIQDKYTPRSETFNNFPIYQSNQGTFEVNNSEELWWAVEHNYLPTFPTNDSRAEYYWKEALDICRKNICDDMSDLEKIDTLYSYIATNIKYDFDAAEQNGAWKHNTAYFLEGSFSYNYSVCDSLSKMMALLSGIENLDVYRGCGYSGAGSQQEGHAWNYASLDGGKTYYIVCPTWGRDYSKKDNIAYNAVDRDAFMAQKNYFNVASRGKYRFFDNVYFEKGKANSNYDVFANETYIYNNQTLDFSFSNFAKIDSLVGAMKNLNVPQNYSLQIELKGVLVLQSAEKIADYISKSLISQGLPTNFYYHLKTLNRSHIFTITTF